MNSRRFAFLVGMAPSMSVSISSSVTADAERDCGMRLCMTERDEGAKASLSMERRATTASTEADVNFMLSVK